MADITTVGSEFQSLPLEYLVSAPLLAAVQAQATAAATTQKLLADLKTQTVEFETEIDDGGAVQKRVVKAPLLTCVPVPHLRIDSLTTHFKFEINQISKTTEHNQGNIGGEIGLPVLSSLFSLKGSLTHESSRETTTNRSGMLEITVHASEAEMPAGLQKVLSWMTAGIQEKPAA